MSKSFLQRIQTAFFTHAWKRYSFLSINDSLDFIDSLEDEIQSSGYSPDIILGVCTGGIFPSKTLATRFEKPLTYIDVDAYDVKIGAIHLDKIVGLYRITTMLNGGRRPEVVIAKDVDEDLVRGKKVLVVDDDSFTGRTLDKVAQSLSSKGVADVKTAVLYTHNKSKVDYAGSRFSLDELRVRKMQHPWSKLSPYYDSSLVER